MVWQDIVMAIANSAFAVSLIPQVYSGFKEKKGFIRAATSLPTFIGVYAVAFCMHTLGLFYSSIVTSITATMWLILFIQRMIYRKA
jgi:hypothetical protein